ncbi:DUF4397 domain-containing protein [Anaerotignum sp.]|uniref:DUF4397 domain-containing protein n=1 Tax=Anaerotignum sp. TaxID=2039241 RepID=UPI002714FFA4|nr:DUF4397 domain-containing protein [Anaerotignum sp.]
MTENNSNPIETSDKMMMPLPLSEEDIQEYDDYMTVEKNSDVIRRLCPQANIVPNVKDVQIPIVPGITLYSYLRLFNAFSCVPKIDIYINNKKVASALEYKSFTEYYKIFPGYYRIQIFAAGETQKPLLVTCTHLIGYLIYTAAITGIETKAFLELLNDRIFTIPDEKAALRLVQLSPNAPVMDAFFDDFLALTEVDFREISRYLLTPSKKAKLTLKDYVKKSVLLEQGAVPLESLYVYTAYVIGNMNVEDGLELLVKEEGMAFLSF